MPIYAYRCEDCGHAQDFLQKMSDPPIAICPNCGSSNFKKQLTAAGFQLKGGGWYVTDFRDSGKKDGKKPAGDAAAGPPPSGDKAAAGGEAKSDSAAKPGESSASPSSTASTPAAGTGSGTSSSSSSGSGSSSSSDGGAGGTKAA